MRSARLAAATCLAVLLSAASVGCDVDDAAVEADEQDLSVTSGAFKVSLNVLAPKGGVARVHGLANQPLERAFSFIPDDEVGSSDNAPKSFTSKWGPNEVPLFLGGRPAFFAITTTAGEHFVARGDLGVKAHVASSSSGLKVSLHAQSVVVGGAPFVRLKGSFGSALASGTATIEGVSTPLVVTGKTWRLDAPNMPLGAVIAKKSLVPVSLVPASLATTAGSTVTGQLTIELEMRDIDITTGDAYETWPAPSCAPDILACLQDPANAVDASACGDAFHVMPCWKTAHP